MLTKNELKKLRNEITLNSVFLKDYSNSLYIKEKTARAFFDSYMEYLNELSDSNELDDILKNDNFINLWNYYLSYENDPLLKNDFIASKSINNSDSIVIYGVNGFKVITACLYLSGLNMKQSKLTRNKLYYDNGGDIYFIKDKKRYYLNDFIRVNF